MNNTTYHPGMKTAVSSFRLERSTLKKRLDKYQEQHSKTLRHIERNKRELTRSLSSESDLSADTHNPLRRRTCSLYGSEYGESFAAGKCDDQHSVCDSTVPPRSTNGQLTAGCNTGIVMSRSCSSARSSSVTDCQTTHHKSKKVFKRQARVENIQESEVQRSLVEQTKTIIISNQERSQDAFKDQNHDKYKMNLTAKSQHTADKRSTNSFHEYELRKATNQNDKGKSLLSVFINKTPLPSMSNQNANSSRATEPIKSVDDISRTILEPDKTVLKQRLRPTKSMSPISTTNGVFHRKRSKTFECSHSENLLARKQVDEETKNINLNEQYWKRCHRNAWSAMDDNYTEKSFPTPASETYPPSQKTSLRKQSVVKEHLSNCEKDKIALDSTEIKEKKAIKCHEPPTSDTRDGTSEAKKLINKKVNDHVMHTTVAANHESEGNLGTESHSPNDKDTKRHKSGNGSEDNYDSRDMKTFQSVLEPQSKGWRKLRALPLTRLKQISEMGEAERKLPVLQDTDRPGLMSLRQVVLAAVKKDEEQAKKKKTVISKQRLNEIQQPTESFLRQTIDKKMRYTAHAPRPLTEERSIRGPEFHAIARGIQGFQTLSSVGNANRLLRAEKIRKKSSVLYTRTPDLIADRQKTISEMMDEVKNCRYLRNKEYVS